MFRDAPHGMGIWAYGLGCYLVGLGPRFRRKTIQIIQLQTGEHVLDVDKPTGPWRNNHVVKDKLEGHAPEFIQNTGYLNRHHPRSKWRVFIAFWLATKPGK